MSAVFDSPSRASAGTLRASPTAAERGEGHVALRAGRIEVRLARDAVEIERAQALRHRVFVGELGARAIASRCGSRVGEPIEVDFVDPYCRHLLAFDRDEGTVVGAYRVLFPDAAAELGCLYADGEFWLTRLAPIRSHLVELGRACVAPAYRSGAVIRMLWAGLSELLASTDCRYLLGCASVPLADGGRFAADLYQCLAPTHLAPEPWRAWPRRRLDVDRLASGAAAEPPALMRGYLRAGAVLLGEPHCDDTFGCADFPLMLELASLDERLRRRLSSSGEASRAAR